MTKDCDCGGTLVCRNSHIYQAILLFLMRFHNPKEVDTETLKAVLGEPLCTPEERAALAHDTIKPHGA